MRSRFLVVITCTCLLTAIRLTAQENVVALNDAGWKALNAGDSDRAVRLFNEALIYRPDDPVLLLGSGASLQAQGHPDVAIRRLKRAVELDPRLIVASRLLGQIAYREGETELAIRTYENALEYAPADADLRKELADWRGERDTHALFDERRDGLFRVMFEGRAEERTAAAATRILQSAFWRIGNTLGEYPNESIVTVLYTGTQFRDITRAPEWANGRYDGRIRVPVAGARESSPEFARVLTHELVHAMLAALAPRGVPTWLNEGIAQHFDGASVAEARRRMAQRSAHRVPLQSLEGSFERLSAADATIAYDESLLAAAVLFDRPGFSWSRLLHTLAEGQPFARAIESFGFSYSDFEGH